MKSLSERMQEAANRPAGGYDWVEWLAELRVLEARIEVLEADLAFWHGWAVKLEPRLGVFSLSPSLTDDEVARAKEILAAALAKPPK